MNKEAVIITSVIRLAVIVLGFLGITVADVDAEAWSAGLLAGYAAIEAILTTVLRSNVWSKASVQKLTQNAR
jgi:hypothetical protein